MLRTDALPDAAAPPILKLDEDRMWQALLRREAQHDGDFVFAVSSTQVYCRPSCPARRPRRDNVSFFATAIEAENNGYRACLRCKPRAVGTNQALSLIKSICRYIEKHLEDPNTLSALAKVFHLSPFHLQRTFKSALGITPRAYAESCRMQQLKGNLQAGHSVTRAMYDAGYSSSSRLYERAVSQMGMTPDKYRRGSIALPIRYSCVDSPLGRMLIAATAKGICAIHFADSDSELEQGLTREFPFAIRHRDDQAMNAWAQDLLRQISGHKLLSNLPLDIQATAFQRRVWTYLQSIPRGETRSYMQIARSLGQPTAARAVARACATNRIAVVIPCHRVVRETGNLAGYRWGVERKKALLEFEKNNTLVQTDRNRFGSRFTSKSGKGRAVPPN